jgi:D-alanyl-D-alanine carboxypeptidase (penicillin-binding protein 5/6)
LSARLRRTTGWTPPALLALSLACLLAVLTSASEPARAATLPAPSVAAKSAILIDRVTGRVLWSKRSDLRLPMASTTKIMTLLIVLEHRRDVLDERFEVPDAVAGSTGVGLQPGDTITYRQAITGMIVRSATDCALALAADVAGSEDRFVVLMNQHARAWRLTRTRYTNASGAPADPRHVTSARDLAMLGRRAMRDEVFRGFVAIKEAVVTWDGGSYHCTSKNWILRYPWGEGIKPGYTPLARYCLAAAGQPGLRPLISTTLYEPTRARNMRDNADLLLYGSSLYRRRDVVLSGAVVARKTLPDGSPLTCVAGTSLMDVVVRKRATVSRTVSLTPGLVAQPAPGAYVGTATYRADGESLGVVDLYATSLPATVPAVGVSVTPGVAVLSGH